MIQRIQSLYLLLAALLTAPVMFLPLYVDDSLGGNTLTVDAMAGKVTQGGGEPLIETNNIYVLILAAICVVLSIATIFLYKNRPIQMKLARLVGLLNTGLLVAILFFAIDTVTEMDAIKALAEDGKVLGSYQVGAFLPIGGMILGILAGRAILKDEALVRASSRFR